MVLCCFFSSLIDGCPKYKNKEKPKTVPRPGLRLNYDVKIGLKPGLRDVKKMLKCRTLKLHRSQKFLRVENGTVVCNHSRRIYVF